MSLVCSLLDEAIVITCDLPIGGLVSLYVANHSQVASIVDTTDDGIIDTITMTSPGKFFEFQFNPDTSNWTQEMMKNENAIFFDQTITVKIPYMEAAKRQKLILLTQGKFKAIAKMASGKYFLLGEVNGLQLTKNSSGSGTKKEDGNGYTLEFKAIGEFAEAKEVDSTIIAGIIA